MTVIISGVLQMKLIMLIVRDVSLAISNHTHILSGIQGDGIY